MVQRKTYLTYMRWLQYRSWDKEGQKHAKGTELVSFHKINKSWTTSR